MGNLFPEANIAIRIVILVVVMLLLLARVVGKVRVFQCEAVDSYPVLHKYLHPGDLIIGAIVSYTHFVTNPNDFKGKPPGILSEEAV